MHSSQKLHPHLQSECEDDQDHGKMSSKLAGKGVLVQKRVKKRDHKGLKWTTNVVH